MKQVCSFRFSVFSKKNLAKVVVFTDHWPLTTGHGMMRVAVEAEDLAKAAQLGEHLRAVQGPLLPGPEDRVQRGVGNEQEGNSGVEAAQFTGQPAAAGVAHPKERPAGARERRGRAGRRLRP